MRTSALVAGLLMLAVIAVHPASANELVDPGSGTAVTLPAGWTHAAHGTGVLGRSADGTSKIFVARVGQNYDQLAATMKTVLETLVLSNVAIQESKTLNSKERGPLAAAKMARGTATERAHNKAVQFHAMLVKNQNGGGTIAIGYAANTASVRAIVDAVHVRQPTMEATRQLRDDRTGATVQLPAGWRVHAYCHGLVARSPDGKGVLLFTQSKRDNLKTAAGVRSVCGIHTLKDVHLGAFTSMSAPSNFEKKQATGTAKDTVDSGTLSFLAVIGLPIAALDPEDLEGDKGLGTVVAGGWRDVAAKPVVTTSVLSLHLPAAVVGATE